MYEEEGVIMRMKGGKLQFKYL